jgi:hypothetical protein
LTPEQAFSVLRDGLPDSARRVVDDFLAEENGDVIAFFSWLEVRAFMDSAELLVRTGDPAETAADYGGGGAVVQYDPSVCEGVYIVARGRVYDFSIKSREIS